MAHSHTGAAGPKVAKRRVVEGDHARRRAVPWCAVEDGSLELGIEDQDGGIVELSAPAKRVARPQGQHQRPATHATCRAIDCSNRTVDICSGLVRDGQLIAMVSESELDQRRLNTSNTQ